MPLNKTILLLPIIFLSFIGGFTKIWEQDLFWLVRDGELILRNLELPRIDTYSSTAYGQPWFNFYWLSSILFYGISLLGLNAFVLFRIIFALALFGSVAAEFRRKNQNTLLFFLVMPLFFFSISYKIQMRPDFIHFIIYALLIFLWNSKLSFNTKIVLSTVQILLATNTHQGTAPIVTLLAVTYLWADQDSSIKKKVFLSLVFASAFLVAPDGLDIFRRAFKLLAPVGQIIHNPDYESFGVKSFSFGSRGWYGFSAVILTLAGLFSLLSKFREVRDRRHTIFVGHLLLMVLLSCYLERTVPFLLISTLPWVSTLPVHKWKSGEKLLPILVIIVWLVMMPLHIYQFFNSYGVGIDDGTYPVSSSNFIREENPKPNIYHPPIYGNYLLYALPGYKVFVDTREIPFRALDAELAAAYHSPEKSQELYRTRDIRTILMPIHQIALLKDGSYWDRIEEFFPKGEWALVFFDRISMVFVKRIPEHSDLIKKHEYHQLHLNVPPSVQVQKSKDVTGLSQEAERCLSQVSEQWLCLGIKLAVARLNKDENSISDTTQKLEALGKKYGFNFWLSAELDGSLD